MNARRFATLVLLGMLSLQAAWIAIMPPFRGIDEIDHVFRAAAVAHGEWLAGPQAEQGRGRLVSVPESIVDAAAQQCLSLEYMGPDNCRPVTRLEDGLVSVASSAGGYAPVIYALIGWPSKYVDGAAALYAMRCLTALGCALLMGAAAWALAMKDLGRWSRAGFVLAISPVAVYSTTVVAPNGIEFAAGMGFWCALIALGHVESDRRRERRLILLAGVCGILLAGLRMLGPIFMLATLIACWYVRRPQLQAVVRNHTRLVVVLVSLGFVTAASQAWWIIQYQGPSAAAAWSPENDLAAAPASAFSWVPNSALVWPLQMVAAFPFRGDAAPAFVYPTYLILFMALVLLGIQRCRGPMRRALLVLSLSILLTPFILTALTYSSMEGVIWQGRYILPLACGLPILAGIGLDGYEPRLGRIGVLAGGLLATINAACLIGVLNDELDRKASVEDANWHHPPAIVVALWVLGVFATLATAAHKRTQQTKEFSAGQEPHRGNSSEGHQDSGSRIIT